MSSCILHLDNYQGQYFPGNTIVGRVVCSFNSPKNVRGIRVRLRGKEHTEWTEHESHYDSHSKKHETRTVHYKGNNKFLAVEITVVGSGDIDAGRHEYPFSFNLPRNLPGTFHNKHGWIKFSVKATVDIPYKFDYEDEAEFTVVSLIDFNNIRDSLQLNPVGYSNEKMLCCGCCASGPITMNVQLEKEAFVQGETALVKVEITNMANDSILRVQVVMSMTTEAKVTSPRTKTRTDYELLATASDSGVGAHGERTYDFKLEIPKSAAIPNFSCSELFDNRTTIKVTAEIDGCHSDLDIETAPIVMGHIPLAGPPDYQHAGLQQTINSTAPPPPIGSYQYPSGGMPYPPTQPYPPDSTVPPYPIDGKAAPYPPSSVPPSQVFPMPTPSASGDLIGFNVPSLPAGALPPPAPVHSSAPYPSAPGSSTIAGPSAPPMDDAASAPTKEQMADGGTAAVGENTALLGGNSGSEFLPPSYSEAMSFQPK